MKFCVPALDQRASRLARLLLFLPLVAMAAAAADTFSATGPMAVARKGHTATRLPDGRVLVAGGLHAGGSLAAAELYDPAIGVWSGTGSLHTARSGHTAVLLKNGRVLVVGGRDGNGGALASAELFDPSTGAWSVTGAMSTARRHHTATLLPNGRVLVVGGSTDDAATVSFDTTEIYNPASGTWSDAGLLSYGRSFHTATLVSDYVHIVGGISGGTYVTVIELYSPDRSDWDIMGAGPGTSDRARKFHTATLLPNFELLVAGGTKDTPLSTARLITGFGWNTTGSMSGGRSEHTATLLPDARVLVVGGVDGAGAATAGAETYQRTTGSWASAVSLTAARAGHAATPLPGGRVLITGGYGNAGPMASCELFTPAATEWSDVAPMATGRALHNATLLPDGNLLVSGGVGWFQAIVGSAEVYNPAEDAWATVPPFSPRVGHTSTLLTDGRVLVVGGYSDMNASNFPTTTTLYDPAAKSWNATGPLNFSRAFHCAVLLPNGQVLIAGGGRATDPAGLNSAELYDPATGAWSATGSMASARSLPAATLLTNGKVLVLSGTLANDGSPVTSAELYDPLSGTWSSARNLHFLYNSPSATLLPNGKVLVAGSNSASTTGKAELYDPVTDNWQAAAPMTTDGFFHSATLLRDGRVLVAGNYMVFGGGAGKAEIYDPAANTWTFLGRVTTTWHTATLLTDGRTLLAGGEISGVDPATIRARAFDPSVGSAGAPHPAIASVHFDSADRLVLSGSGFTDNPLVAPVVQLRRLDNGHTISLTPDPAAAWSETSFTSQSLTGFPQGHAMVTVLANGIPGVSTIVSMQAPEVSLEDATGAILADGGPVNFGSLAPATSADINVTVRNLGRTSLTGLAVTFTGPNADSFILTGAPVPSVVEPNGVATLTVRFSPATPGVKTAVLRLVSNDADENPFDLRLTGTGTDTSPTITAIADRVIPENGTTGALAFALNDNETPLAELVVNATSSNPALVPVAGIVLAGSGGNRTVAVTPLPDKSGTTIISLTVSDGVFQSDTSFTLTVTGVNTPPTIGLVPDPTSLREDSGIQSVGFSGVSAGLGDNEPVTVTAVSSNPALIPHPVVSYASPASSGTLTFTPVPGMSGSAVVTVSVSDGQAGSPPVESLFTVRVLPTIRAQAVSLLEGNQGTTQLRFRFLIGAPQTDPVTFQYTAAAGTATFGSDFTNAEGVAAIPAGETETTVIVGLIGDTLYEADETVRLFVADPINGFLEQAIVTGTILNDDPQPALNVTAGSVTESATGGPFQVWISASLSAPQAIAVTWLVSTRAGTAQAGSDFAPLDPVPLTFAPGETVKWVAIGIPAGGSLPGEADEEDFYVEFSSTAGAGSTMTSTCTIKQLEISDFHLLGSSLYAVRFPTGNGQRYSIEESDSPAGPWINNSPILLGNGSLVTQVVFSAKSNSFFRVIAAPAAPGSAAVGP